MSISGSEQFNSRSNQLWMHPDPWHDYWLLSSDLQQSQHTGTPGCLSATTEVRKTAKMTTAGKRSFSNCIWFPGALHYKSALHVNTNVTIQTATLARWCKDTHHPIQKTSSGHTRNTFFICHIQDSPTIKASAASVTESPGAVFAEISWWRCCYVTATMDPAVHITNASQCGGVTCLSRPHPGGSSVTAVTTH